MSTTRRFDSSTATSIDALHFSANDYVYGLQGFPAGGGTHTNSLLIDLNDYVANYNKTQIGDVVIPCPQAAHDSVRRKYRRESMRSPPPARTLQCNTHPGQ